ncbi:hypothetical protein [Streptomyces mirabilis]
MHRHSCPQTVELGRIGKVHQDLAVHGCGCDSRSDPDTGGVLQDGVQL